MAKIAQRDYVFWDIGATLRAWGYRLQAQWSFLGPQKDRVAHPSDANSAGLIKKLTDEPIQASDLQHKLSILDGV